MAWCRLRSVWLVLLLVAFAMGYRISDWGSDGVRSELAGLQLQFAQLEQLQGTLQQQLQQSNAELLLERATNQANRDLISELQLQGQDLKRELTFYRNIMAPEKEAEGIVIDAFRLEPAAAERFYRFDLVLLQLKRNKEFSKGDVSVMLEGSENGLVVRHDLLSLAGMEPTQGGFKFRYFQTIDGTFRLPDGFVPERIEVTATRNATRWTKKATTMALYRWDDLLTEESGSGDTELDTDEIVE